MISVIFPAYNEARRIEKAVNLVKDYLENLGYDYEIIIAEDGSTDGTDVIARNLAERDPRIVHIHSDERLGRGRALANAIRKARGDVVVYLDVDLSTDLDHLKELIESIKDGYDISIGSRLMEESIIERPLRRDIASRIYNFLVRFMLGSNLRDHQCGFKAFRKSSIVGLLDKVKDGHWFWDTEILILAQREGLKIREIPVRWKQSDETKVRFMRDVLYMFSQILRMWMEQKKSKKFIAFSLLISTLVLLSLAYFSGFGLENLLKVDPFLLALAVTIYAFTFLVRGIRFEYIIRVMGFRTSYAFSSEAVALSQMINVLTPARIGDLARVYVFKLKDIHISTCLSALAVERFFDLMSVVTLSLLSISILGSLIYVMEIIYAIILIIVLLSFILILSKMENFLGRISKDAKTMMKKGYGILTVISILNWTMDVVTCYIIALPFNANLFVIMLAVTISNIVKAFPITPGGVGTYEVAMTGIISAFGLNPANSFTIALVDHALKNFSTLALGYIFLTHLNLKIKDLSG